MTYQFAVVLVIAGLVTGCSNGLNTNCEWPEEPPKALRVADRPDAQHLRRDVELAEELSIRFGDERWSPGPTRQKERDEQCLAPLLERVAILHSISLQDVLDARERIADRGLNLGVNLPVGLVVTLLAAFLLRRIERRFSVSDEWLAIVGSTIACALLIAGVTLAIGRLWEAVFETVRLGNGHLSYRGVRLPWTQHSVEFEAIATAGFVVAAICYFVARWVRHRRTAPSWHAV